MKKINTIYILIIFLVTHAYLHAQSSVDSLLIDAKFYGVNKGESSLTDMDGNEILSAPFTSGKFSLGPANITPGLYQLIIGKAKSNIFLGNEHVKISGYLDPEDTEFAELEFEGSVLNERLESYNNEIKSFKNSFMADYRAKYKKGPTPEEEEVLVYEYDRLNMTIAEHAKAIIKKEELDEMDAVLAYTYRGKYYESAILLYNTLSDKSKDSEFGLKLKQLIDNDLFKIANGQPAPDFTLETPDGKTLALHELQGKILVLDFWAAWCSPCRKELVQLKNIYADTPRDKVEFVSIALDETREAWVKAMEEEQVPWINLWDSKGFKTTLKDDYNFKSIPFIVVIDQNGNIAGKMIRRKALEEKINELLSEDR